MNNESYGDEDSEKVGLMIQVSRLRSHGVEEPFYVNPDLVVTVEATPDTILTLTTGDKLLIAESPETFAERFAAYKRRVYS